MKYIKYYLKKIKNFIRVFIETHFNRKEIVINSQKRQAYILFGADYCNLGDIAITYAQEKFLRDNLGDNYEIITIKNSDILEYYLSLKKNVNSDSIITFIGGGNNGDIYEFIDFKRRLILKTIKNCKILSFPQTVVYSDTFEGKKKLKEFIRYSKNNKNFYIMAREKNTFEKYKNYGLNNVFLVPDIVFYLDNLFESQTKDGIGFVLRNDCEKSLPLKFQENLIEKISKYDDIEFMDTCGYDVDYAEYIIFLKKYIKKISSKKLIITDRLHGMIFCFITGTPCIVFNNNNSKISSTYETWLNNQNFILLSSEKDNQLYAKIKYLLKIKKIEKENIKDNYRKLLEAMK